MPESRRDPTDTDSHPQPFLISYQLLRARKALEKIFASRETEKITFLRECYGPISFKCSVVGCPHNDAGFEKLQERDSHVRSHNRPFKCPELGCFYREAGFANNRSLSQHTSQCHTDPVSSKFIFPRLGSSSYSTDEQDMFREAIESNNLGLVRDLVQAHSSLQDRVRPGNGHTALQHAARYGKVEIAELLLNYGSQVGAVNASGSALSVACIWAQADMVRFLLSKSRCEEDVNSKNFRGETPLLLSGSGVRNVAAQVAVLRLLLDDNRVSANSKDRNGKTVLALAAERGNSEKVQVVRMLLQHNRIDVDAKDNGGRTPLSRAAGWGVASAVKMFLNCGRGVDVSLTDAGGRTPLSWAASRTGSSSGAVSVVKMLLDHHGTDADAKDNGDRTPLSWAAGEGLGEVVEVFLERRREVDVNAMDSDGRTPLSWAAARAKDSVMIPALVSTAAVRILLKHDGIDVDARDKGGRTPLSWAASSGMAGVVEMFLQCDRGVDVNAEDNGGRTPLSWAVARENDSEKVQVVQALIKHGGISG